MGFATTAALSRLFAKVVRKRKLPSSLMICRLEVEELAARNLLSTGAATVLVKDINTNPTAVLNPQDIIPYNGKLYFSADDGVSGRELWVSDGTASGCRFSGHSSGQFTFQPEGTHAF